MSVNGGLRAVAAYGLQRVQLGRCGNGDRVERKVFRLGCLRHLSALLRSKCITAALSAAICWSRPVQRARLYASSLLFFTFLISLYRMSPFGTFLLHDDVLHTYIRHTSAHQHVRYTYRMPARMHACNMTSKSMSQRIVAVSTSRQLAYITFPQGADVIIYIKLFRSSRGSASQIPGANASQDPVHNDTNSFDSSHGASPRSW